MSRNVTEQDLNALGVRATGFSLGAGRMVKKVLLPSEQPLPPPTMRIYPRVTHSSVPGNLFRNGEVATQITIPKKVCDVIHHISLKIDVHIREGPAQLVPVTHWFKRINLQANNGDILRSWYPDTMFTSIGALLNNSQSIVSFKNLHIDSDANHFLGLCPPLQPGHYSFYLPLVSSLWDQLKPYWADAKNDLILYLIPEGTIVATGNGVVDCTGLSMIFEGERMSDRLDDAHQRISKMFAKSALICQPVPVINLNERIQTGVNRIDISSLRGKVSFLEIIVREPGSNNINNGYWKQLNLGDSQGATIDIVDASNQSVLGGSAIDCQFIKNELWVHNFKNSHAAAKSTYVIPHGTSVGAAFVGKFDGYRQYTGQQEHLQLNVKAPINEVQTLTCSKSTLDSGVYRFKFRGELSEWLEFDAPPAQMSAAIAKMRVFARNSVTVEFSSGLHQGATTTATFTCPETNGLEGDLLDVVSDSLQLDGELATVEVELTTAGRDGIKPGSYDVIVYGYVIRRVTYADGIFHVEDL